jgi:hypothetical protein
MKYSKRKEKVHIHRQKGFARQGMKNDALYKASVVAHTCNSSYTGGGDQEDHRSRLASQKVSETPSQPTSHMPMIPARWEA